MQHSKQLSEKTCPLLDGSVFREGMSVAAELRGSHHGQQHSEQWQEDRAPDLQSQGASDPYTHM